MWRVQSLTEQNENGTLLYWQHDQGWVDKQSATQYTVNEIGQYLPANSILEQID